ncbi:hypothetical protein H4R19_007149 [Coemansia spiralis]|nr:hypothetical protein H4R19_007149 [Coemansia spiralis]
MLSAVTRTGVLNPARGPLARAAAAGSVRAFVATAAARKAEDEPQSVVAERALKNRPISPHISIYQPQMSWVLSGIHRNAGVAVGGAAFLYTAAFGLAPMVGMDLSSVAVTSMLAAAPTPLVLAAKALVSSCLSFHCINGIRHLVWDTGKAVTNQGVFTTGYAVIGATALATGYLTFF